MANRQPLHGTGEKPDLNQGGMVMPTITGVSHVSLTVNDLGKSEAWYPEVLDVQKVATASRSIATA
jgi:catechol-2,3-dioxygenase